MSYVDVCVVPVPKKNIPKYREFAERCSAVWREHGALSYQEAVAEDVKPGKTTSFPQAVKLEDDETVVVAYITYKDRAHRDEVNSKSMADPRLKDIMGPDNMPFDGKRMFMGGFEPIVEA